MKKKKNYSLLDQMNSEPVRPETKELSSEDIQDFTQEEINAFINYNEKVIGELDELYTSLRPRKSDVILRLYIKDFTDNDDVLSHSKVDLLPVASGQGEHIVYGEFPNPYPFSKKAVVVATSDRATDLDVGDVVSLADLLQVRIGSKDSGIITVQGAFVHPDYQDNYDNMPQDPNDRHYGYVIVDEMNIQLILNKK